MHNSQLLDKISESSSISPNSSYLSSPRRIKKNPRINVAPVSASYMGFFKMGNMAEQQQNQAQKQISLKQKQNKIDNLQQQLFTKKLVLNRVERTFSERSTKELPKIVANLQKIVECIISLCKNRLSCKKKICQFLLKNGNCSTTDKKSNIFNSLVALMLLWIHHVFQLVQKTIKHHSK